MRLSRSLPLLVVALAGAVAGCMPLGFWLASVPERGSSGSMQRLDLVVGAESMTGRTLQYRVRTPVGIEPFNC